MRAITYLSPGIPLGFYRLLAATIGAALGEELTLSSDPRFSGPPAGEPNPLAGDVDLAFVCGPSYLAMANEAVLVPAGAVFADSRSGGRPVYFAEVVAAAGRRGVSLDRLAEARFAYNDPVSLSGLLALTARLRASAGPPPARMIQSGSHEASLRLVAAGEADICSVDSVVWRRLVREGSPTVRGLRVVETLGPFPIQPIVASRRVGPRRAATIAAALLAMDGRRLAPFGATGFAPIGPADYEGLRGVLTAA